MILGKITGKGTTKEFKFLVTGDAKKFDFIQVLDKEKYVLANILEIEKDENQTLAFCGIIGYAENGSLNLLRSPLEPGSEVLYASDDLVMEILGLSDNKNGAFIGNLYGRDNIRIYLDINKLLSRHISIIAKSGFGKCLDYNQKVLLSNGTSVEIGRLVEDHLKYQSQKVDNYDISYNNSNKLKVVSINSENSTSFPEIKAFTRRKAPHEMYKIRTRTGKEIITTPEHPIALNVEGIQWIQAKDIKEGSYVLVPRPKICGFKQEINFIELWQEEDKILVDEKSVLNAIKNKIIEQYSTIKNFAKHINITYGCLQNRLKNGIPIVQLARISKILEVDFEKIKANIITLRCATKRIPARIQVDCEFARLVAYLLAEGHNTGKYISFTNNSKKIQEDFNKLVNQVFNEEVKKYKRENELRINNKILAATLKKICFTSSSWTKFVPEQILMSEKHVIVSFLGAFIDCDGYISTKRNHIEICLASKQMLDQIEQMFLRFGIVSIKTIKTVNGRNYSRLGVGGACYLNILNKELNLLIDYKKSALECSSSKKANTNIDVIPNLDSQFKSLLKLLRLPQNCYPNVRNYIRREDSPSYSSLKNVLGIFEKRYRELQFAICEIRQLFYTVPQISEKEAMEFVVSNYGEFSFSQIAMGTGISSTTARRLVRGITTPMFSSFRIAQNTVKLRGEENDTFEEVIKLDLTNLAIKIQEFCEVLNIKKQDIELRAGLYKNAIYSYANNKPGKYSSVYNLLKEVFNETIEIESNLREAERQLGFLKSIVDSNLFFDEIVNIEIVKPSSKYVYDLAVEGEHNFMANNIIVHNSYTVSVLIEELLEKKVPIVIIDPHGEYSTLKYPNDNLKDLEKLSKFGLEKKGFIENVKEYSPNIEVNTDAIPLKLSSSNVYGKELINLLPTKLSNMQLSILYSCLKELNSNSSIDDLLIRLELEENSAKWTLINIIEYLRNQNILSDSFTPFNELVKQGTCSIVNLRGVKPELQEVVVYKLLSDLFNERKKQNIAPFFLVLEESHNFIPERGFGEAKSLPIIRQIFSEGRKFGLGACLISQRPSRVDKSAISQCTTQIVLKVTNPNDVRAVSSYVEGLTIEMEKEISNLPAGTAIITGIVDMPLVVEIRPRRSKHGGTAVDLFNEQKIEEKKPLEEIEKYNNKDLIPVIKPKISINDFRIISGKKDVKIKLIPCGFFSCLSNEEFNIIVNLNNGDAVIDFNTGKGERFLFDIKDISTQQRNILNIGLKFKESFTAAELFSRSNVQFSEIYDVINILTAKGYLKKEGNFYSVNRPYSNILRLPTFKCYEKIEYTSIEFNELIEDRVKIDYVKEFLSNYFKIKNYKECFLVSYY